MSFITAIYNIISTSRIKTDNVHHALDFNQSPCLKQYIDFNTQKIANAKNPFKKDFFKLTNNSVFGKTMENIRK